jgi:hypothetical protein
LSVAFRWQVLPDAIWFVHISKKISLSIIGLNR